MKKFSRLLLGAALVLLIGLGFESCRKINEATPLGGDLVPAVDNITTFADSLPITITNMLGVDSSQLFSNDEMPLGVIANDPEFGNSRSDIYFNFGPNTFMQYPFYNKDSVQVNLATGFKFDSAVLSLGVTSLYGDSSITQRVRAYEIDPNAPFADSVYYTSKAPDFPVITPELGTKDFEPRKLYDTVAHIRARDTSYRTRQLRIRFDGPNAGPFINRFIVGDTIQYRTSGFFYTRNKGIGLRMDTLFGGGGLSYFNLVDSSRSKLTIYYRVQRNGKIDTTFVNFYHGLFGGGFQSTTGQTADTKPRGSQAAVIRRFTNNNGGNWLVYLNSSLQDKVYVQSEPGSQTILEIPQLSSYSRRVIHRAELIMTRVHTTNEDKFPPMPYVYLMRTPNGQDAFMIADDSLSVNLQNGALNATVFGGRFNSDDTYRFNITRHVQNIVNHGAANDKLKLFAPMRYTVKDTRFPGGKRTFGVLPRVAYGRVVLAGSTNVDPNIRMRLRIIYSNL